MQNDQVPYIESLGDHWGTLCVTPNLASDWADNLLPVTQRIWLIFLKVGVFTVNASTEKTEKNPAIETVI